jgi:hypothetical protein
VGCPAKGSSSCTVKMRTPLFALHCSVARQDESTFRKVHLSGNRLHFSVCQPAAVEKHGQRIPFELSRRKNIPLRHRQTPSCHGHRDTSIWKLLRNRNLSRKGTDSPERLSMQENSESGRHSATGTLPRHSATVDTVCADFYPNHVFCPSHAGAPCCRMCSQSCG